MSRWVSSQSEQAGMRREGGKEGRKGGGEGGREGGQGTYIWVPDGIATGAGDDELPVQRLKEAAQLVVSHDLLEAELQVFEEGSQVLGEEGREGGRERR